MPIEEYLRSILFIYSSSLLFPSCNYNGWKMLLLLAAAFRSDPDYDLVLCELTISLRATFNRAAIDGLCRSMESFLAS